MPVAGSNPILSGPTVFVVEHCPTSCIPAGTCCRDVVTLHRRVMTVTVQPALCAGTPAHVPGEGGTTDIGPLCRRAVWRSGRHLVRCFGASILQCPELKDVRATGTHGYS